MKQYLLQPRKEQEHMLIPNMYFPATAIKRFAFIVAAIMLLPALSACAVMGRTAQINIFDENFIDRYKHTLNAMFDNEWIVVSVEERFSDVHDGFICSCGFDGRHQQFVEWTIEYFDGNGNARHFVLDNRSPLALQVERHVEQYLAGYFKANFFDI